MFMIIYIYYQKLGLTSDYFGFAYNYFMNCQDPQIALLSDSAQSETRSENGEIKPAQLSGDQHAQGSILSTVYNNHKANFLMTVTIIMKSTIGAGIISLPYTISRLGYVLAILLFALIAALTQYSCSLLLKSKNLSKHSNYSTIMQAIWNHKFSKMLGSLLIFLDNMGTCIAELIIFKEAVRKILQDTISDPSVLDEFYTSSLLMVLIMAAIEFPIIFLKKIERLKIFSFFGVTGIIIFMICIVIHYIIKQAQGHEMTDIQAFPQSWFEASSVIPNVVYAYSFQTNYFPIYKGLKNANDKKMNLASIAGIAGCGVSYLLIGILGYSLVGDSVDPNFLTSIKYSETSGVLFYLINSSYLISIVFAFSLMFFSSRNNFIAVMNLIISTKIKTKINQENAIAQQQNNDISDEESDALAVRLARKKKKDVMFIIYTLVLYTIIVVAAILLQDIQVIFNFLGAICQNLIGLILPSLFYIMLINKWKRVRSISYYLCIVILAVMTPYAIFSMISNYI